MQKKKWVVKLRKVKLEKVRLELGGKMSVGGGGAGRCKS